MNYIREDISKNIFLIINERRKKVREERAES